jgi:hypothetical protein
MENENTNGLKYYSHMNLKELVRYCDVHSETPRALFRKDMIAQMIDSAGNPKDYPTAKEMANADIEWQSLHEEMKTLVNLCNEKYNL